MGPFTCIDGNRRSLTISKMINGRPAEEHFKTQFFESGHKMNVESLSKMTDVGGKQFYSAVIQKGANEVRKVFLNKGGVFIGQVVNKMMSQGRLFELQADGTYHEYEVTYDHSKIAN